MPDSTEDTLESDFNKIYSDVGDFLNKYQKVREAKPQIVTPLATI